MNSIRKAIPGRKKAEQFGKSSDKSEIVELNQLAAQLTSNVNFSFLIVDPKT